MAAPAVAESSNSNSGSLMAHRSIKFLAHLLSMRAWTPCRVLRAIFSSLVSLLTRMWRRLSGAYFSKLSLEPFLFSKVFVRPTGNRCPFNGIDILGGRFIDRPVRCIMVEPVERGYEKISIEIEV